jgi:hypothetical protein
VDPRELTADRLPSVSSETLFLHMVFAEIKPQIEQLTHDEMLKALAFLKSRLRSEFSENKSELERVHRDFDDGKKVDWETLKRQLGLA